MKTIGVRELKAHMSEVLDEVHDGGETVEVTKHGQPIARLVPVRDTRPSEETIRSALADLDSVSAELGKYVSGSTNAADAVSERRR